MFGLPGSYTLSTATLITTRYWISNDTHAVLMKMLYSLIQKTRKISSSELALLDEIELPWNEYRSPRPAIGSPRKAPIIRCRVCISPDCYATFLREYTYTSMTICSFNPLQIAE